MSKSITNAHMRIIVLLNLLGIQKGFLDGFIFDSTQRYLYLFKRHVDELRTMYSLNTWLFKKNKQHFLFIRSNDKVGSTNRPTTTLQ